MTAVAERWRVAAGGFTRRARAVPAARWDSPSPCEGWVARDIVVHLVEWVPPFVAAGAGIEIAPGPDGHADPVRAWTHLDDAIRRILEDPEVSTRRFNHERAGRHDLDAAIDMFVVGDVLIHTWDVARATGLDEALDAGLVADMLAGIEPLGDTLAESGQYGPRVQVPDDADPQTKLLALTGRKP